MPSELLAGKRNVEPTGADFSDQCQVSQVTPLLDRALMGRIAPWRHGPFCHQWFDKASCSQNRERTVKPISSHQTARRTREPGGSARKTTAASSGEN